jgi:hypothetical protein
VIEETKAERACFDARQKINELWKIWAEEYPDSVDQTFYVLVDNQIGHLKTLVRLAAKVE